MRTRGLPHKISSTIDSCENPYFELLQVPEGRHTVAHRLNGGTLGEMNLSPVGATHLLGHMPPLRGLALKPYASPPPRRWATIFRPSRDWPRCNVRFVVLPERHVSKISDKDVHPESEAWILMSLLARSLPVRAYSAATDAPAASTAPHCS